ESPIEIPHQPVHFAVAAGCIAAVGPNLVGHAVARLRRCLSDEILRGGVGMNVDDHVVSWRTRVLLVDDYAHPCWLPSVARIALLRPVPNAADQIHFRPETVVVAAYAVRRQALHAAILVYLEVEERNEGIGNVTIIETPRT